MVWHIWQPDVPNPALAPLVLFHGGSGSWTHWLRNIDALTASGRVVYVPDMPGFGDSATPLHGGDADALPEPIEQGLQLLLGSTPCDVAGFSFGGMVGGLLAGQFPARVSRLVLLGAPGLGVARPLLRLRSWRHFIDPVERDAAHRHNLAVLMLHDAHAITELVLRLHVANVVRDRMQARSLSRTDVLVRTLAGLSCPVHAIYGREDALYAGKLDALESGLQKTGDFRGLTLVDGAGHWVQYEQAQVFNTALLRMLDTPLQR